jgi:3-deoxy-D-manno-octulosonate 8-phosphate phosphatase (KDO 8-P phosphatase)
MHLTMERARNIRLIVFDVDGVMTDGTLFLGDDGQEYKGFNSLDGHGLKMLKGTGVELAIITGRSSKVVEMRAANLGIEHVYQGCHDKLTPLKELLAKLGVAPENAAFMGDDVVDLPPMRHCGMAFTVPHAPSLVKERAHYITHTPAGHGAVREVCELVMQAHGTYADAMAPYIG